MKVLLLFILNLTGHSFAAPIEDEQMDLNLPLPCVEHSSDGFLDWVEAVQDRLVDRPWHSVQASMVEKAPCRRKRSLDNILKELADIQGVGKDYPDAEVRGLRFKGQNPALVTAFRDLVTKTNFLGEDLPEKKQENLEKAKD
jgi:hypothetical protein